MILYDFSLIAHGNYFNISLKILYPASVRVVREVLFLGANELEPGGSYQS